MPTESQRRAAKVAGISCLLSMAIIVYVNFAINARLIVQNNTAETARNILAHEQLFRINIVGYLLYSIGVVVFLTALYTILAPVSRGIAMAAAIFRLMYALPWVVMAIRSLDAIRLLKNPAYLQVIEADRLQALARMSIASGFDLYYIALLFFSLASTVCAYLWWRSRYIPRALAMFGLIGSAWGIVCTIAFLIWPDFSKLVNLWFFDTALAVFEMTLSAWLLIKGLRAVAPPPPSLHPLERTPPPATPAA
jgi:hypothetical protein